ncbi:hypothetical protein L218DRAFT_1006249 [Marasmius fiardii PR-910]|nr:hypothetical protein L218DRAFT_1006249 [Marasmius fiardii PR-910]
MSPDSSNDVLPPYASTISGEKEDLRGRILLRDEDSGEIVGELDKKVMVKEDPSMYKKGHEDDPVVIEIPEDAYLTDDETAIEAFARNVPPDQHDWMTKSATLASHAITETTNLIVRGISTASSYYISHSTPSSTPSPTSSRTAAFLSSDRTRKGLTKVHAASAKALQASSGAINFVDQAIYRVAGGKKSENLVGQEGQALPTPKTLGRRARFVLSADLILSTIEESTKKLIAVGADHGDAMVRHKYGPEAAESSASIAKTAKNVGLVYIDLQGIGRKAIVKRVAKVYVKNKVLGSSR